MNEDKQGGIEMDVFNYYWRGLTAKKSNPPKQYGMGKLRHKHKKRKK